MRKALLVTVFLGAALPSLCQSTTASTTGWARVQALLPDTSIKVQARSGNASCQLQSAGADSLVCLANGNSRTFQRADIKSIKVSHRARSIATGAAIGAGGGTIIGVAATRATGFSGVKPAVIGGIAISGALVGAAIGAATDFTRATLYKAP